MNSAETIEQIKSITQDILSRIGVEAKIKAKIIDHNNEEIIWVNIDSENDSSLIIGQKGSNLAALQHLVRMLLRKKVEDRVNFIIDINQYKEKRIVYLKKLAEDSAREVASSELPITLEPMSAFDRRIIHTALSFDEKVTTESIGDYEERRVMIKLR